MQALTLCSERYSTRTGLGRGSIEERKRGSTIYVGDEQPPTGLPQTGDGGYLNFILLHLSFASSERERPYAGK